MSYELKCRFCHEKLENCTCTTPKIRKFSAEENAAAARRGQGKRVTGSKPNSTSNKKTNGQDIRRT